MKLDEAKEIMDILYTFYPNFNRNAKKDFDKRWLKKLMQGDYERTLKKTEEYTESSVFPPSLADIFAPVYKPISTELTDMQKAREAVEREKGDPELSARREEALRKFDHRLEELRRSGK